MVAITKYNKKSKSIMLISMVLLIAVISGAMLIGAYSGKSNKNATNEEKAAVAIIVEGFGSKLQIVSLSYSKDIVEKRMQDNYGTLVSQALIKEWISGISDSLNVPGRLTSSPWPDRIEILSTEKLSADEYKVSGKIIEMTSVEKLNGGVAAKRRITLVVRKIENRWIIDDVTFVLMRRPVQWQALA